MGVWKKKRNKSCGNARLGLREKQKKKKKEKKCRKARLVLECYRKAMIRVPEEHTNAKSGSVGSAGKRGLECQDGAGNRGLDSRIN